MECSNLSLRIGRGRPLADSEDRGAWKRGSIGAQLFLSGDPKLIIIILLVVFLIDFLKFEQKLIALKYFCDYT